MSSGESDLPFARGEAYKIRYLADHKPWDRPGRPKSKKSFMGTYRGMSLDGERHVFTNKMTSYGIRSDQIVKVEHLDWIHRKPGA